MNLHEWYVILEIIEKIHEVVKNYAESEKMEAFMRNRGEIIDEVPE